MNVLKVGQNHRIFVWKKDGEGLTGLTFTEYRIRLRDRQYLELITWHQGPIKVIDGKVDAKKYMDILDECLWPLSNYGIFIRRQCYSLKEYRNHHVISWPAYSPDLNSEVCVCLSVCAGFI